MEEVAVNPTIELLEFTQDCGNRILEGTNKTLGTPGPGRKEHRPHKRLTQTCVWSIQESLVEIWVCGGLFMVEGTATY